MLPAPGTHGSMVTGPLMGDITDGLPDIGSNPLMKGLTGAIPIMITTSKAGSSMRDIGTAKTMTIAMTTATMIITTITTTITVKPVAG